MIREGRGVGFAVLLVTTSKALVTSSDALVPISVCRGY